MGQNTLVDVLAAWEAARIANTMPNWTAKVNLLRRRCVHPLVGRPSASWMARRHASEWPRTFRNAWSARTISWPDNKGLERGRAHRIRRNAQRQMNSNVDIHRCRFHADHCPLAMVHDAHCAACAPNSKRNAISAHWISLFTNVLFSFDRPELGHSSMVVNWSVNTNCPSQKC